MESDSAMLRRIAETGKLEKGDFARLQELADSLEVHKEEPPIET